MTLATAMHRLDRKLEQIERRVPGVLSVSYADLATEAGCRAVWQHCLPLPLGPCLVGRGVSGQHPDQPGALHPLL